MINSLITIDDTLIFICEEIIMNDGFDDAIEFFAFSPPMSDYDEHGNETGAHLVLVLL